MATTMHDYSILNILEALSEASIQIKADGVYTDKEGHSHNLTVFSNDYFRHNCLVSFRSWKCTLWDDPEDAFPALFNSWWASRKDLYLKQAYAYTLKYNPIENYSSHEVMTDDTTETEYGHTIDHRYNSSVETTPPGVTVETTHPTETVNTTPYGDTVITTPADTSTHSTKGFNSTTFVETEKDENGGQITETTTHQGQESVTTTFTGTDEVETTYTQGTESHTGYDTDEHDGNDVTTRNYTLDKTGNIGVQTASQMLEMEFSGLKQDLAKRALYEFITRYCFQAEALDV